MLQKTPNVITQAAARRTAETLRRVEATLADMTAAFHAQQDETKRIDVTNAALNSACDDLRQLCQQKERELREAESKLFSQGADLKWARESLDKRNADVSAAHLRITRLLDTVKTLAPYLANLS